MRLLHPEGLIFRGARVLGSAGFVWCENTGKDEWVLHVDPPLEAGGTIEIDSWMPFESRAAEGERPKSAGEDSGAALRQLPGIQPIGVERYSGSLAVRRPGDWTGRLENVAGADPISDESFVKAWGSLPDDPLTLCGTRRFVRECRASLADRGDAVAALGQADRAAPARARARDGDGRGRALRAIRCASVIVEARIPRDLRITQVSAPGLGDWSTTDGGRLQLMFDGSNGPSRRRLRLVGFIPVSEDPLKIGPHQHRIAVPWIEWNEVESLPGFLVASSISKLEVAGASGMTLISSESSGPGGAVSPRNRLTFGVDDPRQLGEISWVSLPARVSVLVDSQMTIHPDSPGMGGRASLRRGRRCARRDPPQDARGVVRRRRPSFRRERPSIDDRDAWPDCDLDDHAGAADLGLADDLCYAPAARSRASGRSSTRRSPRWAEARSMHVWPWSTRPAGRRRSRILWGLTASNIPRDFRPGSLRRRPASRWVRFGW